MNSLTNFFPGWMASSDDLVFATGLSVATPAWLPPNTTQHDEPLSYGGPDFPIDVAVEEDDVTILSSQRASHQTRSIRRPRKRQRAALVVIDGEDEVASASQPGVIADEESRSFHASNRNNRERIQPSVKTNCDKASHRFDLNVMPTEDADPPEPEYEKLSPERQQMRCPICLSEVTLPCSTLCGHIFCRNCIKICVQKQKKCPTCRRKLGMRSFHRVYIPTAN